MTAPANFPRWFHLIIMYPAILCLTITAGHTSDHDNPRFKLTPYHYTSPSPPAFILPESRLSVQPPPSPRKSSFIRLAPESPPRQSPSAPPHPYSAYDTSPPETDIPSPSTLSGSLRRRAPPLAPPSPNPNRNFINPRPPQSPSAPPPPYNAYDTPPPEKDIPSPSTLSGSLIRRPRPRLAPPSPYPSRNYINPRPPAFVLKSPPPPLSPPPSPTPHADIFYRPSSH